MQQYNIDCRACGESTVMGRVCKHCHFFNKWPVMK